MAKANAPAQEISLPYTLRAIYLRSCSTWMDNGFDPLLPGQQLASLFRTSEGRVEYAETTVTEKTNKENLIRSCAFTTRFDFAYTKLNENETPTSDEDIEKAIVAKITADITVDYLVNTSTFKDPQFLKKWGTTNVLLHAWPYWREICHSNLMRMNLPVTMMPLIQFATHTDPGDTAPPQAPKRSANKIRTKKAAAE